MPLHIWIIAIVAIFLHAEAQAHEPPASIDFVRDVKPILAQHCYACHGPEKQRGQLRLDRKIDAFKGGDSGVVIVAGSAEKSLLFRLVSGLEKDSVMPPKGERLSAKDLAILRSWIDTGAKWPDDGSAASVTGDWWSFKPLKRPAVPNVNAVNAARVRTPVDAFILAKLKEKKLTLSEEADKRTLLRRLTFDLIGLPPTPEDLNAFLKDDSPKAYEKVVDRLLSSPQYGERWARHWLDVVHYGDTHGYDKDKPRPHAWPYRDYVIRALNNDKPYGRFVQEQVAGDVLFPGEPDGIEALGFLAAGPWDFIGHVEVSESKIDGKIARHLDRDDMVANTIGSFVGLTVHCAQCHNHKFDPISQEDYYSLQAVFAAIDRTDRTYDTDAKTGTQRAALEATRKSAETRLAAIEADARKRAGKPLADKEREIAEAKQPASLRPEYGYHSAISPAADQVKWVQIDLGKSVKLERVVLHPCHDDFNHIGADFGFPVRFRVEASDDPEFKKQVAGIADRTAMDFPNPGTAPVAFTTTLEVRYLRVTATRLAPRMNDFIFALAELEAFDVEGKNRAAGAVVSALDSIEVPVRWRAANLTDGIFPGNKVSADELAKLIADRDGLLDASLGDEVIKERSSLVAKRNEALRELASLPAPRGIAYIGAVYTGNDNFAGTGAKGGQPRKIFILPRGDVTKPGKEVGPGAIAAVPGLVGRFSVLPEQSEGERRAALARWLSDPANPLTWRVAANRVWQYHLGRGIVDTPSDFGKMGQLPSHAELLDWLATELRDNGGSLKKLHKIIVMSSTYRQVPASNEANSRMDADNRYLWRQNRRKLEAEAVRDTILSVSGKLDLTPGGPGFQDFVIEKPEHSPHYEYQLHDPEDPKSHRRAIYRFIVRSKQQPFMAALDCADPSSAVDRRNQSISPQQALSLLNNRLILGMSRHFAARVEKLSDNDAGRISAAYRLALGRDASIAECQALADYAKAHGLANACRVILNLNEFIFVD